MVWEDGARECPSYPITLPRPWKFMRSCAIIHPLHLELETAT